MKLAKRIILLSDDPDAFVLAFVLRNSRPPIFESSNYSVTSANSDTGWLWLGRPRDLLVILQPLKRINEILDLAKSVCPFTPRLVIDPYGVRQDYDETFSDRVLLSPSVAEILECVAVMCKRKRGPRKGSPAAMRCGPERRKEEVKVA
jgi:hypothetical protein